MGCGLQKCNPHKGSLYVYVMSSRCLWVTKTQPARGEFVRLFNVPSVSLGYKNVTRERVGWLLIESPLSIFGLQFRNPRLLCGCHTFLSEVSSVFMGYIFVTRNDSVRLDHILCGVVFS